MIKTRKNYLLIFLIITSCQTKNRLENQEEVIIKYLEQTSQNKKRNLTLDTISGFAWDEVIVAGPYSDFEEIETATPYNLNRFPNTLKSHDHYIFIGFINNKKGIHYIEIPISLLPVKIYKSPGQNYKIYLRENSKFDL